MSNKELIAELRAVVAQETQIGDAKVDRLLSSAADALAAVSDTTPSEPSVVRHNEWQDGSYQEVYSDGSSGPVVAPTPSEGEREALREVLRETDYEGTEVAIDAILARGFRLTPPAPVDREKLNKAAVVGAKHTPIMAWSGGAVPEPMGEVCSECGDKPCTADAELAALAASPAPARDEWEYGSVGYCFDNEVNRRCYYESHSADAVIKHARDAHANDADDVAHRRNLRRRHPATDWESLPVTEEERDG